MVPGLQAKLLRFLEEKSFKRVGGERGRPALSRGASDARPAPSQDVSAETPYDAETAGDRAPGGEDQGGYVDVDDHQY